MARLRPPWVTFYQEIVMTAAETRTLASLRKDLAGYHLEVREHIARFKACDEAVQALQADMYGTPGNKKDDPGLIGEVAKLRGKWRSAVVGLRWVWAALTLAVGTIATVIFGK